MNSNNLSLIIRGTEFVFDTADRLIHFLHGYNAGQTHATISHLQSIGHFEEDHERAVAEAMPPYPEEEENDLHDI